MQVRNANRKLKDKYIVNPCRFAESLPNISSLVKSGWKAGAKEGDSPVRERGYSSPVFILSTTGLVKPCGKPP